MTKPLALLLYENLRPGSTLVNRLQDLDYRVQVLANPATLLEQARATKPLLVIIELTIKVGDPGAAITALKGDQATAHIPILAYCGAKDTKLKAKALKAGATLVASDTAILEQFPQILEQLLLVE